VDYRLTEHGIAELRDFGIELGELPAQRRLIRYCIDWSEQRHHLAGALGAAIADRVFELGWAKRAKATRAVHLTDDGKAGFAERFGVTVG